MKLGIVLASLFVISSSQASVEVICGSKTIWATGPMLERAIEAAKASLNEQLSEIPNAGFAGYRNGNPIEVTLKKASKTEITSNVSASVTHNNCGDYGWGIDLGFCTQASLCTTIEVAAVACKKKYEENSGQEYAICPSGRRIEKP